MQIQSDSSHATPQIQQVMSLNYAAEFLLSHNIIITSHYSCQKILEEVDKTLLDCVKLTVIRDNKIKSFIRLCWAYYYQRQ